MRRILAASILLLATSAATPGMARPYPWCIGMPNEGGALQCRFTSFEQCQATAIGLGECYENPVILFARQSLGTGNSPPPDTGWRQDGSNNGHRKRHSY
jgi:Protein of unknown function (DUF3551)